MRRFQSCYYRSYVPTVTSLALFSLFLQLVSGQQMGKMHGVGRKRSHSSLSSQHTSELLALWIDGKQVESFIGHVADLYLIKGGVVNLHFQEPLFMSNLPVLPPDMDFVQMTWKAEKETFRYKFSDLRSMNPDILYNPLLSIPASGDVPKQQSAFELTIACTRNKSGIATMSIVLNIYNSKYEKIAGSPLEFHLRKKCEAADRTRGQCKHFCKNGGKCIEMRRCECKPGYTGHRCETVSCQCENGGNCLDRDRCKCPPGFHGDRCQLRTGNCNIPCKNGGYCTLSNVCSCPEGYSGQFCQRPICSKPCGMHGKCVEVDKCECYRGWRGRQCNKTAKVSTLDQSNDGVTARRRKRRKLRQSETHKLEARQQRKTFSQQETSKKKKNQNQKKPRKNKNGGSGSNKNGRKMEEQNVEE